MWLNWCAHDAWSPCTRAPHAPSCCRWLFFLSVHSLHFEWIRTTEKKIIARYTQSEHTGSRCIFHAHCQYFSWVFFSFSKIARCLCYTDYYGWMRKVFYLTIDQLNFANFDDYRNYFVIFVDKPNPIRLTKTKKESSNSNLKIHLYLFRPFVASNLMAISLN